MNFQGLKNIEDYKFYLDVAFNRAKKKAAEKSQKKNKDRLNTAKDKELARIDCVDDYLNSVFSSIETSFPSIDGLPDFYYKLCKLHFDTDDLKKSLAAMPWARAKIKELAGETRRRIKTSETAEDAKRYRNMFYGRVDSIMKKISKQLEVIEKARRTMKGFPAIKQDMLTVAVVGFPNVGKSTLISALTGSDLEVNSYSFTTRRLLIGYIKEGYKKIQLIDTPGTLNREDKKNDIERQAELAMEHAAHGMIYVFDPTEQYPLEKQERL
ncbi:MAG: GTPase, partial [Candidatus Woesearchaeota archaeon]